MEKFQSNGKYVNGKYVNGKYVYGKYFAGNKLGAQRINIYHVLKRFWKKSKSR